MEDTKKKKARTSKINKRNSNLIKVNKKTLNKVTKAYYQWKKYDACLRDFSETRGAIFPSEISEYFVCYACNLMINKSGTQGDAIDMSNKKSPQIIEIKCSSATVSTAPNSFSPSEQFDDLIYARLDKASDTLNIYRLGINSEDLKNIKVNNAETIGYQQTQKRRPRISIKDKIIDPQQLTPDIRYYIKEQRVECLKMPEC